MIDTHSHIYSEEFDNDRSDVINRALESGVNKIILANVDLESYQPLINTCNVNPGVCFPTVGLHPTSIKENYKDILSILKDRLNDQKFVAIGEIGLDLYWDKTFIKEQIEAFETQIEWSLELNLPIIVHVRDAFKELHEVLQKYKDRNIRGIIHSFSGDSEDVIKIKEFKDLYFGINGVVTFKNSSLSKIIPEIGLEKIVLETDAPYLSPVPFRGKRNESSYVVKTGEKIAEILGVSYEEVEKVTTKNSEKLFNFN